MPKMSDDYFKNYLDAEWDDDHGYGRFLYAPHSPNATLTESPTLIVGLGGSGISAVNALKERIDQVYRPDNSVRLEYLLIDTDDIATTANFKRSDQLVVQSADTAMLLREYQRSINRQDPCCGGQGGSVPSQGRRSGLLSDEIYEWLDPNLSPFRIMNGAAGIRQAGRLILFLNFQKVYRALAEKLETISANIDAAETRIKVHIFAGIGGGTGSGMFVDISYLIRNLNENAEIQGILFMPDVSCLKPGLREVHKRNIQRNGFAALKEVEHLMMLERYHEKFRQTYPGKTVRIESSAPLFDFCVLVGSMEGKRKPVNDEAEIYRQVAEYLLAELQCHQADGHSIESQKSNLAAAVNFYHPYYDRYAAIGSASWYLPANHYYSWWITDVIEKICSGLERNINADLHNTDPAGFSAGLFRDIQNDWQEKWRLIQRSFSSENPKTFRRQEHKNKATQIMQENMLKNIDSGNTEIFSLEGWLDLLSGKFQNDNLEVIFDAIENIIRKPIWKSMFHEKRRDKNLFGCYTSAYSNCYQKVFAGIFDNGPNFVELFSALKARCSKYNELKKTLSHEFDWNIFQELQKTQEYQESLSCAAKTIIDDFIAHPALWDGHERTGKQQPLSIYVANLLSTAFEKSGCLSYDMLIRIASNNGAGQWKAYFEENILNKLNSKPLWPCRSTADPQNGNPDFHLYSSVTVPKEEPTLSAWTEDYFSKETAVVRNDIKKKLSHVVMASGYPLHTFHNLNGFEEEYLSSSSRAGLHLYPAWKDLPSPYIESVWEPKDKGPRGQEKDRDDDYRKVFVDAVNAGIIEYCEKMQLYYYCDRGRVVYIGDIPGDSSLQYQATAQEMFLRMFTHRDTVRDMVLFLKVFNDATNMEIIKYDNTEKRFFFDGDSPDYLGDRTGADNSQRYKFYALNELCHMPDIRDRVKEKVQNVSGTTKTQQGEI